METITKDFWTHVETTFYLFSELCWIFRVPLSQDGVLGSAKTPHISRTVELGVLAKSGN